MAERLSIAVIGGGTAGWMTAAALASVATDKLCDLTLVESEEIGTIGVGEATIPAFKEFNDKLGINEAEMMRNTQATFKLGIEFSGWDQENSSYIHPFGTFGNPIAGTDFHQQWLRFARMQRAEPLEAYSLAVQMCRSGRFDFPVSDDDGRLSNYAYAYHLDAGLYARYLRDFAEARGVRRVEGKAIHVSRDGRSGNIQSLTLESGESIAADYFFDCTGFRSLLLGKALGVEFESWRKWLPCDRAVAVASERGRSLPPYTQATAREAGWQWRIPLQHRDGNGTVYNSDLLSDEQAVDDLLGSLQTPAMGDPRVIRFEAGKRAHSWHKNCIAVGLSAGFLEPLESTSIYLIQVAIVNFLKLMPGKVADPCTLREFNRILDLEYERVRDFLLLHYHLNSRHLNSRNDSDLWRHCREMEIPDSLRLKIALFRKRGYIEQYRFGLFSPSSWLSVYMGQGLTPENVEPLAAAVDASRVDRAMLSLRRAVSGAVAQMPSHREFLQAHCSAAMPGIKP